MSNSTNFTLPTGIYYHPNNLGPRYAVKFMLDGARINLGIFKSLADAINAMIDFKVADLNSQRTQLLEAATKSQSCLPKYKQI